MCLQQPSSAVNWPTGIQRAHYISCGKPNSHRNSHRKGYTKSFSRISVNTGIYAEAGVFSTRTLASVKPAKIQFPRFISNDNQQKKDAHYTLKPLKEFLKCFIIIVLALSLLLLFYIVAAIILVPTSTTIPKTVQQQFPENKNYNYHLESFASFERFEQLQAQLPAFDSPWLVTLLVGVSPLPEVIRRRCRTTAPSRHILRTIAAAALVLVFAAAALTIAARCCYAAPNNTPFSNLTPHNDPQPQNTLVEISNPRSTSIIISNLIPPPSTASPSFWRSQNRFRRASHQLTTLPAATKATKSSPSANSDHLLLRKTYNYSYNTKTHKSSASNIPNSADDHYSVSVRTLSDQQVLEVVNSARNDRSNFTTNTHHNINNNNNIISADDLSRVSVKPLPQDKDSKVVEHPQLSAYNSTTSNRLMPSVHVLQQTGDTVEQPFHHHLQHHPAEDVQLQKKDDEASGERGLGAGDGAKGGSGGGGLLALVVSATLLTATLGLITCVVSHYRGGGGGDGGGAPPPPPPPLPGHQLQAAAGQNAGFCVPHTTISAPMLSVMSASAAAGVGVAAGSMDGGVGGGAHSRLHRHHHVAVSRELAAQRDRQVRLHSVHTDLELDLPPSIELPDGEELPYGSSARLHIRDPEQESEIYQKCIRPPPNRTVFESESPPPYRSSSAGLLGSFGGSTSSSGGSDWSAGSTPLVVRCHSMSSSSSAPKQRSEPQKTDFLQRTVKIFTGKKSSQPPPAPTLPVVIVPTRPRHPHPQTHATHPHPQNQQQTGSGAPPRTSSRSSHV